MKSRIVNLTDAGPGVGIINCEVQYQMTQENIIECGLLYQTLSGSN